MVEKLKIPMPTTYTLTLDSTYMETKYYAIQ